LIFLLTRFANNLLFNIVPSLSGLQLGIAVPTIAHFNYHNIGLEFYLLFGVAVATTPKGALHAKSPFGIPVAPTQQNIQ